MLGLSELKQTKVYQEALQEGRQKGERFPLRRQSRTLILRLLSLQIGSLSPDLEAKV
jgi:predicted transposase YdaD